MKTGKYDLLEVTIMEEWRFVVQEYGELFVVISIGMTLMLVWSARVWGFQMLVSWHIAGEVLKNRSPAFA